MIGYPTFDTHVRSRRRILVLSGLSALMLALFLVSLSIGAVPIGFPEVLAILGAKLGLAEQSFTPQQEIVLLSIRLPRIVLAVLIGGALGVAGASLQGLFRNPLVEPGLIGVSSGAALFSVTVIVFGAGLSSFLPLLPLIWLLPVFAFIGGLLVTLITYSLSQREGRTDITVLILAGVAINALAGALIGLVIFYADDTALRTFTFWSLGDLGGASWQKIGFSIPLMILPAVGLTFFYRQLNAIALGEAEAWHMGVNVERVKYGIVILSALAVGTSVAMAGMIGFIGLVVPHMLRTAFGPDHALVLPGSILAGASLLMLADLIARTVVSPSELPIGIVTALIGTPFFIWLLLNSKKKRLI
jgi:iron complex transport system permease protein